MIFQFNTKKETGMNGKKNNLVRQMGNARFLITRSCSILKIYRLACKLIGMERECFFEEKKFTRMEVDEYGNKRWYLGDKLHRRGGPAIEWASGTKQWVFEDKIHRLDGPAIEYSFGDEIWFFEDKIHREDGPAIIYSFGDKLWFFKGRQHREDGPAVERANGTKEWWVDGERKEMK